MGPVEKVVLRERKLTSVILKHITEVNRRKAYFEWGFTSLYAYLTQGLGYSEGSAYRRMQAAKVIDQMPSVQNQIESEAINLCQFVTNGKPCNSQHQLEVDHITPRFAGGGSEPGNLRVLCRAHNLYRYGVGK